MIGWYKKRPIPVRCLQWNGTNIQECKNFCGEALQVDYPCLDDTVVILTLKTLEGPMNVPMGAYLIQGVEGEFYACKESVFNTTYEWVRNDD